LKRFAVNTEELAALQALVRYLSAQAIEPGVPRIARVRAVFGHGNACETVLEGELRNAPRTG